LADGHRQSARRGHPTSAKKLAALVSDLEIAAAQQRRDVVV
jgi:hypothetical protein